MSRSQTIISTLQQLNSCGVLLDGDEELATIGARGDCISGACHILHVSVGKEGGKREGVSEQVSERGGREGGWLG